MISNVEQLRLLVKEDLGLDIQIVFEPVLTEESYGGIKWEYNLHSSKIEDLGIFKHALEKCTLDSFGRIREKDGKYIVNLHLKYEHIDGGSNGCSLGRSYVYNTQTSHWYRLNKVLNTFKA